MIKAGLLIYLNKFRPLPHAMKNWKMDFNAEKEQRKGMGIT